MTPLIDVSNIDTAALNAAGELMLVNDMENDIIALSAEANGPANNPPSES
ncbi:MAG: hypothetical protein QXJ24_05345 [Thermoplasmatales archaeon]